MVNLLFAVLMFGGASFGSPAQPGLTDVATGQTPIATVTADCPPCELCPPECPPCEDCP